jgi:orotate phosphoribosyltransferase
VRQRPQAAALLDIIIITGAAVAAAASALRALGATVSTAACAIDRSPAGSHLLSSERLAIRTVLTKDLIDAASSRPSSWTEPGHSGLA